MPFGDFMREMPEAAPMRSWAPEGAEAFVEEKLEEYNMEPASSRWTSSLLMPSATCRVKRVISMPRGNAMLVGVGGSGRQSLSRLALHWRFKLFTIEVVRGYRRALREDLKKLWA